MAVFYIEVIMGDANQYVCWNCGGDAWEKGYMCQRCKKHLCSKCKGKCRCNIGLTGRNIIDEGFDLHSSRYLSQGFSEILNVIHNEIHKEE